MILHKGEVLLRTVEASDAEFILKLRTNIDLNRFLSSVDDSIANQVNWINNYKNREESGEEYYFIIEDNDGNKYGTLRAYDINEKECMWGSYVLLPERPNNFSYMSASLLFDFLFESLKMEKITMEVFKKNACSIHVCMKMGFKKYDENENKFYMFLEKKERAMSY